MVLSTIPIGTMLGVNLVPRDDQSEFQVNYITPEGYTLAQTNRVITEIEGRLAGLPGVVHRFTIIGENNGKPARGRASDARVHLLPHRGTRKKPLQPVRSNETSENHPARLSRPADGRGRRLGHRRRNGQLDSRTFQVSLQGPDIDKLGDTPTR